MCGRNPWLHPRRQTQTSPYIPLFVLPTAGFTPDPLSCGCWILSPSAVLQEHPLMEQQFKGGGCPARVWFVSVPVPGVDIVPLVEHLKYSIG